MEEIVFDIDWIKVKKTPKGYYFSERKGVDSIAVLLYRKVENKHDHGIECHCENEFDLEVLVRHQPLPILNSQSNDDEDLPSLFKCPITGGIEDGDSPTKTIVKEIEEEAGCIVEEKDLKLLGNYYVGTQTNEVVYMATCEITSETKKKEIEGDGSYFESISKNEWVSISSLLDTEYSGLNILANKLYRLWQREEI
jgi:hypothetical protein